MAAASEGNTYITRRLRAPLRYWQGEDAAGRPSLRPRGSSREGATPARLVPRGGGREPPTPVGEALVVVGTPQLEP